MAGYINPVSFTTAGTPSPQALAQGLMPLSEVANQPGQFNSQPMASPDLSNILRMQQKAATAGLDNVAGRPQGVPADAVSWQGSLPWLQSATPWKDSNQIAPYSGQTTANFFRD